MQRGVERALFRHPAFQAHIVAVPLADGGEGTIEAFRTAVGGEIHTKNVRDALCRIVAANWLILPDGTEVIEMAQASGLTLIAASERDALRADTFGTGELIRAALDAGCRKILVGVGGSATTDGGSGALRALGARFLDENNGEIPFGGAALSQLSQIDLSNFDARLSACEVKVLCDVTNSLCGERGAACVYAPQKGADAEQVELLESALSHFAEVAAQTSSTRYEAGKVLRDVPGAGAAGGTAFGLMRFGGARLVSGIDAILQISRFAQKLESADLVLTGEGSIDAQTPQGKALAGVAKMAKAAKNGRGVPVIAFGGRIALSGEELQNMGIVSAFSLCDGPRDLEYSISNASELLEQSVERALRLWLCALEK